MKLKIKNYNKIVGAYDGHCIHEVIEQPNYYVFTCSGPYDKMYKYIWLNRHGWTDNIGDLVFCFGDDRMKNQRVTTDWFSNIENAINAILSEYKQLN